MSQPSAAADLARRLSQRSVDQWLRDVLVRVDAGGEGPGDTLDGYGDPLFAFRADRCIVKANRSAELLFGYAPGELDGRMMDELLPVRLRQPEAPALVVTGDITSVEVPALRRDGTEVVLSWTYGGVVTASGALFVATTRPRTQMDEALEALHESEERFRLLVDGIRDHALFLMDAEGNVTSWNSGAELIKGWPAHEILGRHYETFFVPEDRDAGTPALNLARAVKDGRAELEGWRVRKDGSRFYAEASLWPLYRRDGSLRGFAKITHDLTERRRGEDSARLLQAERAAREAAERAKEQLRESDRRKSDFLAVLSHELRNPLSAIAVGIDVVEREYQGGSSGRESLEAIRRQADHLARLTEDLLDLNRIERGKVSLQCRDLDLTEVVRQAAEDMRAAFARAEVQLSITLDAERLWVHGDPARLTQVVTNLLHNALKFTSAGGTVALELRRTDRSAQITVRDSGIGMEPEQIARMFEPFAQGGPSPRGSGGLGLGLALIKAITELHGGAVRAHSDGPGMGSEFSVRFGLTSAPTDAAPPPPVTVEAVRRVLLIEDNDDVGQLLVNALTWRGHTVRLARMGHDGVVMAREFKPQVVVCDLGLPDMDGHDVARAMRADPALRDTKLIALSGFAQPEDRQRAKDAGFDVHLAKPASVGAIVSAMAAT
jgi:PAS domain S-box-containing protein